MCLHVCAWRGLGRVPAQTPPRATIPVHTRAHARTHACYSKLTPDWVPLMNLGPRFRL